MKEVKKELRTIRIWKSDIKDGLVDPGELLSGLASGIVASIKEYWKFYEVTYYVEKGDFYDWGIAVHCYPYNQREVYKEIF